MDKATARKAMQDLAAAMDAQNNGDTMRNFTVTYWTGTTETIAAETITKAAETIWSPEFLHTNSIDQDLTGPAKIVVFNEFGENIATITPETLTEAEEAYEEGSKAGEFYSKIPAVIDFVTMNEVMTPAYCNGFATTYTAYVTPDEED